MVINKEAGKRTVVRSLLSADCEAWKSLTVLAKSAVNPEPRQVTYENRVDPMGFFPPITLDNTPGEMT